MDVYRTDRIRNVVLLGHGGAGKTTLVEAMAYLSGMTSRLGKVSDGNTVSDFDKEEIKRQFSISTSVVPIQWNDMKINILDTPGFFDFVGEAEEAAAAADAAVIVVSGKSGVQVGTQKAWDLCEKYKLPRMIFVTEMDIDNVSYRKVVEDLIELYGKKVAPLHMPIRENEKFVGYINILKNKGRRYTDKDKKVECEIPEYSKEYLDKYRESLLESVAETSEEFMDRYFAGEEFSVAEMLAALAINVHEGSFVPVCMGSPINLQGVSNLLNDICGYFPSPDERERAGILKSTSEIYQANYDFTKAKTATVFKTMVDPFIGKIFSDQGMFRRHQIQRYHAGCGYGFRGKTEQTVCDGGQQTGGSSGTSCGRHRRHCKTERQDRRFPGYQGGSPLCTASRRFPFLIHTRDTKR